MNDCEKRLVRSLKDKEHECVMLQKKVEAVEGEKREM
jgi:hypothetical protein